MANVKRVNITIEPTALKQIQKTAKNQNMSFSRFVTNSALEKSKVKQVSKATVQKLQQEMKVLSLQMDEMLLRKKINGNHTDKDFSKYVEIKKQRKNAQLDGELSKSAEPEVTPYQIATGRAGANGLRKAKQQKREADEKELEKVLGDD